MRLFQKWIHLWLCWVFIFKFNIDIFFIKCLIILIFDLRNTYVECPATFNFTGLDENVFTKFGIGLESSERSVLTSTENTHGYHLYPSVRNTSGYMSFYVELQGVSTTFCLTSETDRRQFGFTITEPDCWSRLVSLFTTMPYTEIDLKSYLLEKPRVFIITDVYII